MRRLRHLEARRAILDYMQKVNTAHHISAKWSIWNQSKNPRFSSFCQLEVSSRTPKIVTKGAEDFTYRFDALLLDHVGIKRFHNHRGNEIGNCDTICASY